MLALLERGCAEAKDWHPNLTLSFNVSPVQLRDPWLSQKILSTVTRMGFPPQRLAVEITENALIADGDNARRTIQSLRNQGIRIGLDDFGTGYSSLRHLGMLPFDHIKIDRSFVQAIAFEPEALKLVAAMTSLAKSLNLPVIAEGIESEFVLNKLREIGCFEGQGFFMGRPMPGHQVAAVLSGGRPWTWDSVHPVAGCDKCLVGRKAKRPGGQPSDRLGCYRAAARRQRPQFGPQGLVHGG